MSQNYKNSLWFSFATFIVIINIKTAHAQLFIDKADDLGVNALIEAHGFGAGTSVFDFDNDGWDDISFSTNEGNFLFYRNTGNGFELVDLGVSLDLGHAKAIIWADYDNDGDNDLLTTAYFGEVHLYQNDGEFNLIDVTTVAGIPSGVASNYGASFCDVDRDGNLDLFIGRYEGWLNPPDNPDIDQNRWSRLLKNNGDGTFTDLTDSLGVAIPPSPVFQSSFLDFDKDLWPDLYVIVDRIPGNHLLHNISGHFENITNEYDVGFPVNDIMSNSVSDFNNDGYLDIFMTNNGEIAFQNPTRLLVNNNGSGFSSLAANYGLEIYFFSWGALWVDANNDGWQDLYFTTPGLDPDFFFLNDSGLFFNSAYSEVAQESESPSYSLGKGDFNGDGRYDMAISGRAPYIPSVLINTSEENHFIKITLEGTASNSMAVGSWIEIFENGSHYSDYTMCGTNYISQCSQHRIYGLGNSEGMVDSVLISFPSGHTDRYFDLPVDSSYHFYEGQSIVSNIIASDTAICSGDSITLDAGNHHQYLWNTGDTTRYIQAAESGIYEVHLTNEFGVNHTAFIEITVYPSPEITTSITPNACYEDSLAAIVLVNQTGSQPGSVIWSTGDSGTSIDSLPAGIYSYEYTDVHGCYFSDIVQIFELPELLTFINTMPSDPDQSTGSITITIFGGVSPYSIFLEGNSVQSPITGLAPGEYDLVIQDSYGCTIDTMAYIESTLGVEITRPSQMEILPNPVINSFKIITEDQIESITIFNILGEELFSEVPNALAEFDISNMNPGMYILEIKMLTGVGYTRRIIKK